MASLSHTAEDSSVIEDSQFPGSQPPSEDPGAGRRSTMTSVLRDVQFNIPGMTQEQVIQRIQGALDAVDAAEAEVELVKDGPRNAESAAAAKARVQKAKRDYQKALPQEVTEAITIRRQEWLHCIRCCYLATLNYDKAVKMVSAVFGDIGSASASVITSHFRKRTMKNAANWQYQAIEKSIAHVRGLMDDKQNHRFAGEKGQKRLAEYFEDFFDLEEFSKIFSFLASSASLTKSTSRVRNWCKIVYVELCRRVKMHCHFLDEYPDPRKRPQVHDYDRKSLGHALKQLYPAKKFKRFRMDWKEVARKEINIKQTNARQRASQYTALDDDDAVYTPSFDPDEE